MRTRGPVFVCILTRGPESHVNETFVRGSASCSGGLMPVQRETGASASLNPLAAFTLVLVFPGRTFMRLKDDPQWILPLLFVVLCSMVSGAYAVVGGHLDGFLESMALRTGQDPALTRSAFLASTVLSAIVGVPLVLLLESLFYKLSGMLRGGRASFGLVLSTVAYASVPVGLGALVIAGLMWLTGSHSVGANLSFLVDAAQHPALWSIARQIDLFSIWFFILLGIAAEHIFELPRARARQVGLLFAVFYLFIMSISGVGNAGQFEDPYANWTTVELDGGVAMGESRAAGGVATTVVIHHGPELATNAAAAQLADAKARLPISVERAQKALGLARVPLIDVYLYPSVEAKLLATDNGEVAHAVEWASAVHVAWVEGGERAFTREAAKVSAVASLGKMYNPCIRDGLAIAASGTWGGEPLRAVADEIVSSEAVSLSALLDPVDYARLGRQTTEPLAGSFVEFIIATRGPETLAELHRLQGTESGPAVDAVEAAFGLPLVVIEEQWKDYLRAGSVEDAGQL